MLTKVIARLTSINPKSFRYESGIAEKSFVFILCLCALLTLSSCSWILTPKVNQEFVKLQPGNYQLDKSHTSVLFKVSHMNLSTFVGRFNDFDAALNFDPQDLSQLSLEASVPINSLDVNNDPLRTQLMGSSWFNATQHPFALLKLSNVIDSDGQGALTISGELTLNGITRPTIIDAKFHGGANNLLTGFYTVGFSALFSINRSAFEIDSYIPMVGDKVNIEIYAEFQKVD